MRLCTRNALVCVALSELLGSAFLCQGGIYPTKVEINLSAFPIDKYFDLNSSG